MITLLLFSCKDNAQTNNSNKTVNQKEPNFDNLLKCSDYSYDDGHFFTADYGCIYDPKGNNNFGNAIIYLISKKEQQIADEQVTSETDKVNKSSIAEYKKEFKIYLFLIDKKYLNYNKSADPVYYQKPKYTEKAYKFDDKQDKWTLIDSINVLNESQIQNEQTWRENIISKSDIKKESKEVVSLKNWIGIYINSDNEKIKSYKEIKSRIGWYELKISSQEISYNNDERMESEFPTEAPGGRFINYKCDYNLSENTIRLYEKNENDTSPPKNTSGKGQKLVLVLNKKDNNYYAESSDIKDAEGLVNSARAKNKSPYLFYKFDLNTK